MSEEAALEPMVDQPTTEPAQTQAETPAEAPKLNGYEKRIATLSSQKMHLKTITDQQKAEIETLKAAHAPKQEEIPELPGDDLRYDDQEEYKRQSQAYHAAIARKAVADAEAARELRNKEISQQEQASQQQERLNNIVQDYVEGGIKSGISEVKMQANESVLASANLNRDVTEFLYSDESGAKIVDFLAENPDKMAQLVGASPLQASIMIANEIKPQALSTKPAQTNAPDPIEPTRGGGTPPIDDLDARLGHVIIE
jgi:translation elongation factor EF-Ts